MKDNNIRALEDFAIWIIENVRSKGVLYEGDIMLTASDLDLVKHIGKDELEMDSYKFSGALKIAEDRKI